jgi:transcriptional regulator with XRE-family HTH domain
MTCETVIYDVVTLRHAIRRDVRASRRAPNEGAAMGSKRKKRTDMSLTLELCVNGVIAHHHPDRNSPVPQNLRNRKSAVRLAASLVGVADAEPVHRLLGPGLDTSIDIVRAKLKDDPKKCSTTISHLRWLDREATLLYPSALAKERSAAATEGSRKRIERKFRRFLREHMKQQQISVLQLAEKSGVPEPTIRGWLNDKRPSIRDHARLESLASVLGCTTGELLAFAHRRVSSDKPKPERSDYGKYIIECRKVRYNLQDKEVSPELKAQWARLLEHQVADESEFVRSDLTGWRAKPWPANRRGTPSQFENYEGLYVPSADAFWRRTQSFLGWLRLPKEQGGMGLELAQCQTLAWMAQSEAVKGFIAWLEQRAGRTNMAARNFRQAARSMCAQGCGWLRQQPEMRETLPENFRTGEWAQMCERVLRVVSVHAKKKTKKNIKRSRDPFDGLSRLLELKDPGVAVVGAIRELCGIAESYRDGSRAQAVALRDAALLSFLMLVPVRLETLIYLTVGSRSRHIHIEGDVMYVHIPAPEIKNGDTLGDLKPEPIKSPLVVPIAEYLRRGRPRLTKGAKTDLFMIGSREPDQMWENASARLVEITELHLAEYTPHGIPMQSMRHLVATRYLRLNPGMYQGAASLLHDTLDTVLQTYAPQDPTGAFNRNAGSFGAVD